MYALPFMTVLVIMRDRSIKSIRPSHPFNAGRWHVGFAYRGGLCYRKPDCCRIGMDGREGAETDVGGPLCIVLFEPFRTLITFVGTCYWSSSGVSFRTLTDWIFLFPADRDLARATAV